MGKVIIKNFINDNRVDFCDIEQGDFFEIGGHIYIKIDEDEFEWYDRVLLIPPTEYSFKAIGKCKFEDLKIGETFSSEGLYVKFGKNRVYDLERKFESIRNFEDWEVTKTAFVWEVK